MSKIILVIGATGAQGMAVVEKLLASARDGSPSPYSVRAFTRDPTSRRAKLLAEKKGVEVVKGSFNDLPSVRRALDGAYGAFVNMDSYTCSEENELFLGMRIFEIAKQEGQLKHYLYSSLDYASKKGNYDEKYRCQHRDTKGRIGDWMTAQPSEVDGMTWSILTTTPYMEMLYNVMFGPLNVRKDGTYVFASPIGTGHVPMISLADLGLFARYIFDHREETSGQELEVTSDIVSWEDVVSTFTKVTGKKAVALYQTLDEWFENFHNTDRPLAADNYSRTGEDVTTWRSNFSGWWALFQDDILKRDLQWLRSINPDLRTLESWMREVNYTGDLNVNLLKIAEDGNSISPNMERLLDL